MNVSKSSLIYPSGRNHTTIAPPINIPFRKPHKKVPSKSIATPINTVWSMRDTNSHSPVAKDLPSVRKVPFRKLNQPQIFLKLQGRHLQSLERVRLEEYPIGISGKLPNI
jgi:hypothetical protein